MSDLIDRQAAIDDLHGKDPSQIWDTADIEVWVNALPSAQPDKSYSDGFADGYKRGLIDAQPEQRWIPCSERLPEHGGRYLISVLDGINRRTTVAPYLPRCKAWAMNGRMAYWKVIAWMPLPEPYREDDK